MYYIEFKSYLLFVYFRKSPLWLPFLFDFAKDVFVCMCVKDGSFHLKYGGIFSPSMCHETASGWQLMSVRVHVYVCGYTLGVDSNKKSLKPIASHDTGPCAWFQNHILHGIAVIIRSMGKDSSKHDGYIEVTLYEKTLNLQCDLQC